MKHFANKVRICYHLDGDYMRLDKYLQIARVIKRRTLSKDLIMLGKVTVNGKPAKPANEIKLNDVITIDLRDVFLRIKVEAIKEHVKKEEADQLFKVLEQIYKKQHDA